MEESVENPILHPFLEIISTLVQFPNVTGKVSFINSDEVKAILKDVSVKPLSKGDMLSAFEILFSQGAHTMQNEYYRRILEVRYSENKSCSSTSEIHSELNSWKHDILLKCR